MICPEIDNLYFRPFLKIFKLEFLIQHLISPLIFNEIRVFVYQNPSLSVDTQKQIKSRKLKTWLSSDGSVNTLPFFTHLVSNFLT